MPVYASLYMNGHILQVPDVSSLGIVDSLAYICNLFCPAVVS